DKVSFSLGEGQKAALVGQNGVGKSTMLRIIARMESADRGEILIPNRALVGYLPQESLAEGDEVLRDYLRRMTGLTDLEREMKQLEPRLEEAEALARFEMLESEYRRLGGYDFERRAQVMLEGLCLSGISLDRPVQELSGGEKRKAALLGVLLRGVDILLLDEPTNNLDLPALVWLEQYLKRSHATILVASHDRRFLDNVVSKVVEIEWFSRNTVLYAGGWTEYAEVKAHKLRRERELYRIQEEERERLTDSKMQKKDWADRVWEQKAPDSDKMASHFKKERAAKKFHASAKALESREKKLNIMERPLERTPLEISLGELKDKEASITAKKVEFGYKGGFSAGPVSLKIPLGSRIAILGNNGVGKSTLLKTLSGDLEPLSGKVVHGEGVRIGYLMQEHENIDPEEKVGMFFKKRLTEYDPTALKMFLFRFQFMPDVLDDRMKYVSPGERVRLIIALLVLQKVNVLVLDEPTNHLDLEAIEALEEALRDYPGTLLLVTHDRRFLERVPLDKILVMENGKLTEKKSYAEYEAGLLSSLVRITSRKV
ncbi:MAG: ABC-F family ATP-binding cassette domain-containing protein, partial [Patescibacteria group bacterium]